MDLTPSQEPEMELRVQHAYMTATHLHDLLCNGTMELFVDERGTAGDEFEEVYSKLQHIYEQVRASQLSLSPSKSRFFATDAVFAGGSIGPRSPTRSS